MILLVDDLRTFADGRECRIARTSKAAVRIIRDATEPIEELWLDHDLGGMDTVMPVVEYLEGRHFAGGDPLEIGTIWIHTGNPVGQRRMELALQRMGYNVKIFRSGWADEPWTWFPPDELKGEWE